jgi:(p)ppGpp synthase/HD superfamily hydrolase
LTVFPDVADARTLARVPRRNRTPEFARRLPKTHAAVDYAERMHAGQRRRADGAAFILHPLEVARLLHDAGAPDHLVAAGVLHDTIEKTAASASALRQLFGRRVATLVLAVTEDPRIESYAKRKAALREQVAKAGEEALTLFAADKTSKVRELRRASVAPPKRRLAHYQRSLRLLQELLPESALTKQLHRELKRLPGATSGRPIRVRAR